MRIEIFRDAYVLVPKSVGDTFRRCARLNQDGGMRVSERVRVETCFVQCLHDCRAADRAALGCSADHHLTICIGRRQGLGVDAQGVVGLLINDTVSRSGGRFPFNLLFLPAFQKLHEGFVYNVKCFW